MDEFPLVISFYTRDTYYQWEVQNLIESCQKLEIEHHVEGIDSFGSWELNCAYKPFFIHQQLQKWKRPVLWIDADAICVRKPAELPFRNCDFAVRINETLPPFHPSHVMSGSIYVNYTQGAEKIVRLWAEECQKQLTDPKRTEEFWDQIALRDVINRLPPGEVASLPKAYTKIADHPIDKETIFDAVIEHYQASRRLKKTIGSAEL